MMIIIQGNFQTKRSTHFKIPPGRRGQRARGQYGFTGERHPLRKLMQPKFRGEVYPKAISDRLMPVPLENSEGSDPRRAESSGDWVSGRVRLLQKHSPRALPFGSYAPHLLLLT